MFMIWLEKYKTVIIGVIVAVLGAVLFISKPKDETAAVNDLQGLTEGMDEKPFQMEEQEEIGPIFVDVKGAVSQPGLYEVKVGDRVLDAIEQAGGLLAAADEKQINFAQKVHDEMVVYVPEEGEEIADAPPLIAGAPDGKSNGKVNINRAESSELETLPGIGPAKAQAIIDYREEQGPFKQVEDIKNVSGIGEKTFEKLQESISVN